jgi:multisubunit Na+/H+ antiporter MnhC subunit
LEKVRPVYIKILIAAVVIYVAGTALLLSDLCYRVGQLEFTTMHITGACSAKHAR